LQALCRLPEALARGDDRFFRLALRAGGFGSRTPGIDSASSGLSNLVIIPVAARLYRRRFEFVVDEKRLDFF
jgi:hypothetical protein